MSSQSIQDLQTAESLCRFIDHTLLKPEATSSMIEKLCSEAVEHNFRAVCINPCYVRLATSCLEATPVKACTVVGFPLGATTPADKRHEAACALENGASEIDMVLNTGFFLDGKLNETRADIEGVAQLVRASGRTLKVIIETGVLKTSQNIAQACQLCAEAGAHFVKTCTGFGPGEATVEHVQLMKASIPAKMEVKASGGIRDAAKAIAMLQAGATRLGTSASVNIISGLTGLQSY